MGYMNDICIESQNIYEGVIFSLLDKIEKDIQDMIDWEFTTGNIKLQESIMDAIIRLYQIYQEIQVDLWDR